MNIFDDAKHLFPGVGFPLQTMNPQTKKSVQTAKTGDYLKPMTVCIYHMECEKNHIQNFYLLLPGKIYLIIDIIIKIVMNHANTCVKNAVISSLKTQHKTTAKIIPIIGNTILQGI